MATELNAEAGWNFRATWLIFMLLPAVLTALAGYFGVKFGTRVGVVLGGLEILVFVALSLWMFAHATASAGAVLDTFTLKYATVKGFTGASGLAGGSIFVLLAFVGFEAAAPLAEEARSPRRTVPRAVLLSCLIVGIFYMFSDPGGRRVRRTVAHGVVRRARRRRPVDDVRPPAVGLGLGHRSSSPSSTRSSRTGTRR